MQRLAHIAQVSHFLGIDANDELVCWRGIFGAQRSAVDGQVKAALKALESVRRTAAARDWSERATPVLAAELYGLQGTLLQDLGEPAAACVELEQSLGLWRVIGTAIDARVRERQFEDSSSIEVVAKAMSTAVVRGAEAMITAIDMERLPRTSPAWTEQRRPAEWERELSRRFALERVVTEPPEIAQRAVRAIATVRSYSEAIAAFDLTQDAFDRWRIPGFPHVAAEVNQRLDLARAAITGRQPAEAEEQLDAVGALLDHAVVTPDTDGFTEELAQLRDVAAQLTGAKRQAKGRRRRRTDDPITLLCDEFDSVRAADEAGKIAAPETIVRLLEASEAALDDHAARQRTAGKGLPLDGRILGQLELLRRLRLSDLADDPDADLGEILLLLERLRGTSVDAARHDDQVLDRCRSSPFLLLAERLGRVSDAVLLGFEPGLWGERHAQLLLVWPVTRGHGVGWSWQTWPRDAVTAMKHLDAVAHTEHEQLMTGETLLQISASPVLLNAGEAAWKRLPEIIRRHLRIATTILYLPSLVAGIDRLPVDLLRHPGGWLGTTHVIARFTSLAMVDRALAPNAQSRHGLGNRTMAIVGTHADEGFDALVTLDQEISVARRAAGLLGLEPSEPDPHAKTLLQDGFAGHAVTHYIGHGSADEIGEFLMCPDGAVAATELEQTKVAVRMPTVVFNACLLGRGRYESGRLQRGWPAALLDAGSPAFIGAVQTLLDDAGPRFASAFYGAARDRSVGKAFVSARLRLENAGVHPAAWSAYVLYGDPDTVISAGLANREPRLADRGRRWPADLLRLTALGRRTGVEDVRNAIDRELPRRAAAEARAGLFGFLDDDPPSEWVPRLERGVVELLRRDVEGAAAARVLLAITRTESEPQSGGADEFLVAWNLAKTLGDAYAAVRLLARAGTRFLAAEDREAFAAGFVQALSADIALLEAGALDLTAAL